METAFSRVVRLVDGQYRSMFPAGREIPFALRTTTGLRHTFRRDDPAFELIVPRPSGMAAIATMDLSRIAEAYVGGALDLEGDVKSALLMREAFSDRHPVAFAWRFVKPFLFGKVKTDQQWIAQHYDHPPEFWRSFLDERHRGYSHAFFAHQAEPLSDAMTRKLDFALEAIDAKPGDRVLDVGGGWGSMLEHGGRRGVRITSLTISRGGERFMRELIAGEQLPCDVRYEHLAEHAPAEQYDGIVNLGVSEHLPDYRATLRKYLALLKPGGKIYLDACAQRVKYDTSAFFDKYIYPGNGGPLCLHKYLAEVARTPFQLLRLRDDRESYRLTTQRWAENLDRNRELIERNWGQQLYRTFRLYLWGSSDGFERDLVQAYHWVMQKPLGVA